MDADPDIEAISRLGGVPTLLQVITETTGLRLALVARVTKNDWKACAVHDALGFGMKVGDHLAVATTLCSEVRDAGKPIVIEHASEDRVYCGHPTPKMYGFESYIATPIFLQDGSYFGNVCALDARPLVLVEKKAEEMMALREADQPAARRRGPRGAHARGPARRAPDRRAPRAVHRGARA